MLDDNIFEPLTENLAERTQLGPRGLVLSSVDIDASQEDYSSIQQNFGDRIKSKN